MRTIDLTNGCLGMESGLDLTACSGSGGSVVENCDNSVWLADGKEYTEAGVWFEGCKAFYDGGTPIPPAEPTGLRLTQTGSDTVLVEWDAQTDADSFEIERGPSDTGPWQLIGKPSGVQTAHTDIGVTGTAFYRIRAVNLSGDSAWSAPVSITLT